jgi:hypothetical protein
MLMEKKLPDRDYGYSFPSLPRSRFRPLHPLRRLARLCLHRPPNVPPPRSSYGQEHTTGGCVGARLLDLDPVDLAMWCGGEEPDGRRGWRPWSRTSSPASHACPSPPHLLRRDVLVHTAAHLRPVHVFQVPTVSTLHAGKSDVPCICGSLLAHHLFYDIPMCVICLCLVTEGGHQLPA